MFKALWYFLIHFLPRFICRYFSGHDHDMQHLKEDNSTVNYFVSGAGHLVDSSSDNEVIRIIALNVVSAYIPG